MRFTQVYLRVKPDKAALYEQTVRDLRAKVLANEPGALIFETARDPAVPNGYRSFEGYKDQDAIAAHIATDYFMAAQQIFVECIEGDHMAEIEKLGLRGLDMYKVVKGMKFERFETL